MLENKVCIIGLGYVGLPLAVEFGKLYDTIGYDINKGRVSQLVENNDVTLECSEDDLISAKKLKFSSSVDDLRKCNVYVVTVPTPIDSDNKPDLMPLLNASKLIGSVISKNDVVIYESTVYPGATEQDCVPIIEEVSGLKFNVDFFVGYSPERINPGDKNNHLTNIVKVTSGSDKETADFVDSLYNSIIVAGTHKAKSIMVAEASKIIENIQRDVNIALINELHQLFDLLDIDTDDVINAAATKWNFMKLKPGLVGGHCIGVDPYYLLHKANSQGYIPDLIRTAREINNSMPSYIVNDFLKKLIKNNINPVNADILILGFSFKEDCPDIRNTKVIEVYKSLTDFGLKVTIYDPWVNSSDVLKIYGINVLSYLPEKNYQASILTIGHTEFQKIEDNINLGMIYDFKKILNK